MLAVSSMAEIDEYEVYELLPNRIIFKKITRKSLRKTICLFRTNTIGDSIGDKIFKADLTGLSNVAGLKSAPLIPNESLFFCEGPRVAK